MTDKELRKLSRLELLELLLDISKENEELKEKIEQLKLENQTAQSIEALSAVTCQVENSLKYANSLTDALKTANEITVVSDNVQTASQNRRKSTPVRADITSDREIYRRILCFFAKNDDKLDIFPDDIENDVRTRINNILAKRNTN